MVGLSVGHIWLEICAGKLSFDDLCRPHQLIYYKTGEISSLFRPAPVCLRFSKALAIDPSEDFVFAAGQDKRIRVWSLRSGEALLPPSRSNTVGLGTNPFDMEFSLAVMTMQITEESGGMCLWMAADRDMFKFHLGQHGRCWSYTFDGNFLMFTVLRHVLTSQCKGYWLITFFRLCKTSTKKNTHIHEGKIHWTILWSNSSFGRTRKGNLQRIQTINLAIWPTHLSKRMSVRWYLVTARTDPSGQPSSGAPVTTSWSSWAANTWDKS